MGRRLAQPRRLPRPHSLPPLRLSALCRVTSQLRLLAKSQRKHGLTKVHLALMTGLENNPVLAAYGAVRSGATKQVAGGSSGEAEAAEGAAGAELQPQPSGGSEAVAALEAGGEAPAEDAAEQAPAADSGSGGDGAPLEAPALQQMSAAAADAAPPLGAPPTWRSPSAPPTQHLEAAEELRRYLERQRRPNRYGYLPLANEWDIWWASEPACLSSFLCQPARLLAGALARMRPPCSGSLLQPHSRPSAVSRLPLPPV